MFPQSIVKKTRKKRTFSVLQLRGRLVAHKNRKKEEKKVTSSPRP